MFFKLSAAGILLLASIFYFGVSSAWAQAGADQPLSTNPNAVKEYNKALEVGNKGDKKAAEAGYRKAIKLDPAFALAHNNLAAILLDRGDITGAETSYQAAVQADPKLQLARLNLGSVQIDQKKYDDALQTLDQLITMIGVPAAAQVPESASLGALLGGKTPADASAVTAALNDTQKAKAFYLRGLVNFNLDLGITARYLPRDPSQRDPGAALQAFNDFSELIRRFPESRYVTDAQLRMKHLRNVLAQHEVNVANFYMRRGAFIAAANRARYVIENYQQTPAMPEALVLLSKAYRVLELQDLSDDTLRVLELNYPNHPGIEEVKRTRVN